MRSIPLLAVFALSKHAYGDEAFCCWWPQGLSPSQCESDCQNRDPTASEASCGSPAVWCAGKSPTPAPTPAPTPPPTPTPPSPAPPSPTPPSPTPPSPSEPAFTDNSVRLPPPLSAQNVTPWPEGSGSSVSIMLDSSRVQGQFTRYHMGINIQDSAGPDVTRAHASRLIKQGGFKLLRFPGGSPADAYLWDGSYDKYPFFTQYRSDYDQGFTADDLIALCKETGAEPLLQINYAMFVLYGQEAGTDLAVRWYQYFEEHGITVKYWELGNENSGGWEVPQSSSDCAGFDGPAETCQSTNGQQYGKDFAYVSAALRQLNPDVKIGAWLETNEREDGAGKRKAQWDSLIMPELKANADGAGRADWLNIHSYFWQPMDWSIGEYTPYQPADLYDNDKGMLAQTKSDLHSILQKYYADGQDLPLAMTEWNIDQAFPHADPPANEHISALVTSDIIGQAVTGGVVALNFFAFVDGWKTDGDSPGPADLGMVTWGQPNVDDGTPRPAWFAFAMWERAMGKAIIHSVSSDPDGVTTYASQFDTGEVGLIVINKKAEDLTLNVSGVPQDSEIRGWMLTPSDTNASPLDFSRGSEWNGHGPATTDGSCGPASIEDIEPFATKGVGSTAAIYVPKVSLVGIVFYGGDSNIALI